MMRKFCQLTFSIALLLLASCSPPKEKPIDFATDVYPFIHESCVHCHQPPYRDERGRRRYPQGHLVITDLKSFLRGSDAGEVLVPGKPDESEFYVTTILPLDDDEHMPPVDKADEFPELTDEQKRLLRRWIAEGCDFGDWTRDERYPLMEEAH